MADATGAPPYWSEDVSRLTARLGSGPNGLTTAQAAVLLARHGPNSVEDAATLNAFRLLIGQFESPLLLILVCAAVVSLALPAMGGCWHHPGYRIWQRDAQLLSAIPGVGCGGGTARVLAVQTGKATEFGVIAAQLISRPPESDFAQGVRKPGVIVRRRHAIETLGSLDILCTDKTGTLTEGPIILSDALDADDVRSDVMHQLAYLNAAFETGLENPRDIAIIAAGQSKGLTTAGYTKPDEIPYDFNRRRLTIVVAPDGKPDAPTIVTKGGFANLLDCCTKVAGVGADVALDAASRAALEAVFKAKGEQGKGRTRAAGSGACHPKHHTKAGLHPR